MLVLKKYLQHCKYNNLSIKMKVLIKLSKLINLIYLKYFHNLFFAPNYFLN